MMTWNLYYFWKAHFKLKFSLMHLPPSPIGISFYPFVKSFYGFLAYKWSLHEESGGGQKKHPYAASLKSELEAKYR